MSHDENQDLKPSVVDAELDAALVSLGRADLPPLAVRSVLLAAQRRLAQVGRPASRLERYEAALLVTLSAAHLLWAAIRVLSLTPL